MHASRLAAAGFSAVMIVSCGLVGAGQRLPLAPRPESGRGVTPAFEGWYQNPDGSFTLLFGYFNRNLKEALDIPVGPANRVEPGGPDRGQPTHFLPLSRRDPRQMGVFAVVVPKDFGTKKVTWTLTANDETNRIPAGLHPDYVITPLEEAAQGNTPPVLRFEPEGPTHAGPPHGINASFNTKLPGPLTVTLWATKKPPKIVSDSSRHGRGGSVALMWSKYRGPGAVTFSSSKPEVDKADGKATTIATFTAPGEYILRVQASNSLDRGSNQCCRTNALVKVTVRP